MNKDVLIIFMKTPVLGKVKSRLAVSIGNEAALEVYKILLQHSKEITEKVSVNRHLFYTEQPPADQEWPDALFKKFHQKGADLGERMKHSFEQAFINGGEKVVIMGTDCYDLTTSQLQKAFDALENHDVVVGPANDGGYYLLGMKKLHSSLFSNKKWSTSEVLETTLNDFRSLNLSVAQLEKLNDIDTIDDLLKTPLANMDSINITNTDKR